MSYSHCRTNRQQFIGGKKTFGMESYFVNVNKVRNKRTNKFLIRKSCLSDFNSIVHSALSQHKHFISLKTFINSIRVCIASFCDWHQMLFMQIRSIITITILIYVEYQMRNGFCGHFNIIIMMMMKSIINLTFKKKRILV